MLNQFTENKLRGPARMRLGTNRRGIFMRSPYSTLVRTQVLCHPFTSSAPSSAGRGGMGERIETGLTVGSSRRLDRSRKTRQRRVATYPEPPSPFSPLGVLASWRLGGLAPFHPSFGLFPLKITFPACRHAFPTLRNGVPEGWNAAPRHRNAWPRCWIDVPSHWIAWPEGWNGVPEGWNAAPRCWIDVPSHWIA